MVLLGGLDEQSRFRELWARTPRLVDDPADIAAITGLSPNG
ncbi:hypothetical protein [Streptomyces sp. NRRL B-24484]|nr:hypothetical protein [Streptomyces sp. NRRL B-24484]